MSKKENSVLDSWVALDPEGCAFLFWGVVVVGICVLIWIGTQVEKVVDHYCPPPAKTVTLDKGPEAK